MAPRPVAAVRLLAVIMLVVGCAMPTHRVRAEEGIYQKPVSSRLNFTGRALMLPVPLEFEGRTLGEINVRLEPDDNVLVSAAPLMEKLNGILSPSMYERVRAVPAPGGVVSTLGLKKAGLDIAFDSARMVLALEVSGDQRPVMDIDLSRSKSDIMATPMRPAIYSGYLNVTVGADSSWGADDTALLSPRLELEAVTRIAGVVLENVAVVEGNVDGFICPIGAQCLYEHKAGLKRQRTRLVYDMPERLVRVHVGDVNTWAEGFQRAPDLLGFTIEGAPRKLQPSVNVRPTGRSSFAIDRPSSVEILINGNVVQRLQLRPGSYNLRDLPLITGGNDVEVVIIDDAGERRTLRFSTYFDNELLAPGKREWSASAGVASALRDSERIYYGDEPFLTGYYRQGVTDRLTGLANLQADRRVGMAGLGAVTATPFGVFGLHGATSVSEIGLGGALRIDWDVTDYKGLLAKIYGTQERVHLGAEVRSQDYRVPGDFLIGAEGILFPQFPYWLRFSAAHSAPIGWNITATTSARYQFADAASCARNSTDLFMCGDRYGLDLSLSAPLTRETSGALTIGYSNETQSLTRHAGDDDGELRVMLRFNMRVNDDTRITAGVDSLTRQASVTASKHNGSQLDRWETQVDAVGDGRDKRGYAAAGVAYTGARMEARAYHTASTSEASKGNRDTQIDNRTSVRFGTALVFADGRWAVSRPVRGDGFAIVYPHESLAGKEITVGGKGHLEARSSSWSPAVVSNLPAYTKTSLPIDVADLPVGYSLGSGIYEVTPPYKAGYALEVGSAYAVTVFGTLIGRDGEPVSLVSGTAQPDGDKDRSVPVFTNRVGRFAAEGLAPGRWTIRMETENGPTTYVIDIPKGTDGLYKADTLKAHGAPAEPGSAKADANKTGSAKVDPAKTGPAKVDPAESKPVEVDAAKSDAAEPGPTNPNSAEPAPARPEKKDEGTEE